MTDKGESGENVYNEEFLCAMREILNREKNCFIIINLFLAASNFFYAEIKEKEEEEMIFLYKEDSIDFFPKMNPLIS